MAWGIRPHSDSSATWENSDHDDRFLGFLPSFGLNKRHSDNGPKQPKKRPRGSGQPGPEAAFTVLGRTRRTTNAPSPTPPTSISSRHPLRTKYDDPAFSTDPRSHPHFYDQTRNQPVKQQSSSMSPSGVKSGHTPGQSPHRREPAVPHSDRSNDMNDSTYALLAPPPGRGVPYPGPPQSTHSSGSTATNTTTTASVSTSHSHTTTPSSNYSPPSSNDHSFPVKQSTPSPVNRASLPMDLAWSSTPQHHSPLSYEESIPLETEPEANIHQQSQLRPPRTTRGISAPELHHTPQGVEPPPRPLTAPTFDADNRPTPLQKQETIVGGGSRHGHNSSRPRELDRIDELDETDPFGTGLHHKGPYEAISAIFGGGNTNSSGEQRPGLPKPKRSKRTAHQIRFPDAPMLADPYAPLHLEPGQILARPHTFDPRNLDQTPYHRSHYSIVDPISQSHQYPPPPQPSGIDVSRRNSERQPPHPKFYPQPQQQRQPVTSPRQHYSQGAPVPQVDRPPPPSQPQVQIPHQPQPRHHSQTQPQHYPQLAPQYHAQPPQQPPPRSHSLHQPQNTTQPPPQNNSQPMQQPPPRSYSLRQSQNYAQSPPQSYLQPPSQPQHHSQSRSQDYLQTPTQNRPEPPHPSPPRSQSRHQPSFQSHSQPQSESQHYSLPQPSRKVRTEPGSPDNLPPEITTNPNPPSRYDNQQGPIPLHVPKRLVMPSPLEPQYFQQQHPSHQLRPTPSDGQTYDLHFAPPAAIPRTKSNRAEDISMVPDGRKLQRKRTTATHSNSIPANAPIPMHVPLSEMPAPNRTTDSLKQDQLNSQGQDTKRKEKIRRLSKRRGDI